MSKLDVEGNKLTVLSERLVASWTLLTEVNAAKNALSVIQRVLVVFHVSFVLTYIRTKLHQFRHQ